MRPGEPVGIRSADRARSPLTQVIMRSLHRSLPFLLLLAVAPLAACGDAESSAAGTGADSAAMLADPKENLYGATGAENVRVVPVVMEVPDLPEGWHGMRIAAVSDLQLGLWPDNERVARVALERAVAQRPDMIVLLGNYVTRGEDYAALDRVLAPLRGRPVFAVLGRADELADPEQPDSGRILTVQALQRNGVRVLRNARAPFGRNGDTAYVAGVEPYAPTRPDWRQAEIYGGIPAARTPLLLAHMPAVAARTDGKFPAVVAGNVYCGDIEVPGTPRLRWLNENVFPAEGRPLDQRIYRVRGSTLFVTCGVGYSFLPARFGVPPEVAMITLRSSTPPGQKVKVDSAAPQANLDSLIQVYQQRDTTPEDTAAADSAG